MTQGPQDGHCFLLALKPQKRNPLSSAAATIFAFCLGSRREKRLAAADVEISQKRVLVSHFARGVSSGT